MLKTIHLQFDSLKQEVAMRNENARSFKLSQSVKKLITKLADLSAVGDVKRRYGLINRPNWFVVTGNTNSATFCFIWPFLGDRYMWTIYLPSAHCSPHAYHSWYIDPNAADEDDSWPSSCGEFLIKCYILPIQVSNGFDKWWTEVALGYEFEPVQRRWFLIFYFISVQ